MLHSKKLILFSSFFAILRENVTIFFALKQNEGENYVK